MTSHSLHCRTRRGLAALLLALLLTSCTAAPIRVGEAPRGPIDESAGVEVSAEASGLQFLLFFPIDVNDRYVRAWEAIKRQADGRYITDIQIKDSWTYVFVGTVYRVEITGTAYPYLDDSP